MEIRRQLVEGLELVVDDGSDERVELVVAFLFD